MKPDVDDGPSQDQAYWLSVVIQLAVWVGVGVVCAAAWVFAAKDPQLMVQRAQAISPFGVAAFALVTLCTVVWRGLLNTAQLTQQTRQNDANDDVNYAKLLQEGAKLLAEKEKQAQLFAGIATLEILIGEPKKRFAVEAMDLLADFCMVNYGETPLNRINRAAMRALAVGEKLGIFARIDGEFERKQGNNSYWTNVPGFRTLSYSGGLMSQQVLARVWPKLKRLSRVRFTDGAFKSSDKYHQCIFEGMRVESISYMDIFRQDFRKCDFSDAVIKTSEIFPMDEFKLGQRENYYKSGHPPRDQDGNDLSSFFIIQDEDDIPF